MLKANTVLSTLEQGHLAAGEYPKVAFYFFLTIAYLAVGLAWGVLCFQNRRELLPIQYYISATIGFLIIEMFTIFKYYDYLNTTGHPGVANALLFLVALLNAGRNSLSFFMLLITSMGYGVVRPSLGQVMLKARLLALVHFVFGVLYVLCVLIWCLDMKLIMTIEYDQIFSRDSSNTTRISRIFCLLLCVPAFVYAYRIFDVDL